MRLGLRGGNPRRPRRAADRRGAGSRRRGLHRKCLDKLGEFHRRGKTILFVTSHPRLVEKMCDEALWLRHGKAVDQGDPKRVVDGLPHLRRRRRGGDPGMGRRAARPGRGGRELTGATNPSAAGLPAAGARAARWGSREVEIRSLRLLDAQGRERHVFVPGESLTLALSVHALSRSRISCSASASSPRRGRTSTAPTPTSSVSNRPGSKATPKCASPSTA